MTRIALRNQADLSVDSRVSAHSASGRIRAGSGDPPDLGALHEKTPVAVFVGVLAGEHLMHLHRGHRASPEELSTLLLNGVRSGQSGPVPREET